MSVLVRSPVPARIALAVALGAAAALALIFAAPSDAARGERGDALSGLITARLRAGGPFFTPAEQAVIDRACGYAPGEWDGFEINSVRGVLRCTNGRQVHDPAVRAILRAAEPRIEARVNRVMAEPEVVAAIDAVARDAAAQATREVERELRRHGR